MKKILGSAMIVCLLAACQGTGDHPQNMGTNETEAPTSGVNNTQEVIDSSTTNAVKDSSTTMAHDTGAVRKN